MAQILTVGNGEVSGVSFDASGGWSGVVISEGLRAEGIGSADRSRSGAGFVHRPVGDQAGGESTGNVLLETGGGELKVVPGGGFILVLEVVDVPGDPGIVDVEARAEPVRGGVGVLEHREVRPIGERLPVLPGAVGRVGGVPGAGLEGNLGVRWQIGLPAEKIQPDGVGSRNRGGVVETVGEDAGLGFGCSWTGSAGAGIGVKDCNPACSARTPNSTAQSTPSSTPTPYKRRS